MQEMLVVNLYASLMPDIYYP